jgi:exodeoxyribonuclease-3
MFNQDPGQYTWWDARGGARSRNIGWRIDYFFVNEGYRDRVKNAFIMPDVMGSDHCPIGIELAV